MLSKKGLRVLSQRAKHILESSCPAKCMSTAPEEEKYKVRGRNVLDVMKERPLVGDGGMVIALEKRGYVTAGNWTPEAVLEYPEAVRQLHREFLRAGSDVLQSFTFYAAEGKLKSSSTGKNYTVAEINQAGCDLVKEVAAEGDALTCGGLSPTPSYGQGKGKQAVQDEFRKQVEIYMEHDLDFMLAEFFATIEETEWAIEVMKASGKPCGATMRIGPTSDKSDVDSGECAVRMAAAGADLVGVNCSFGPVTSLKTIEKMKTSLDAAGLEPFLVMQPVAFHTGDCEHNKDGYHEVPEFPLALESRSITRWDARKYARAAYDLGVRYIGGCCGFEPYHIREIAEEVHTLLYFLRNFIIVHYCCVFYNTA
ncbi:unnamed protein product [Owenia fusiformis]|uniref:Hcy-binding domain-containing protein n=1 Tax=Owenia fusiformis TaxID=6347 RepID=A0A8S4PD22_OWEFU|nr:unnamed protein product [Owenia fusiformis]